MNAAVGNKSFRSNEGGKIRQPFKRRNSCENKCGACSQIFVAPILDFYSVKPAFLLLQFNVLLFHYILTLPEANEIFSVGSPM